MRAEIGRKYQHYNGNEYEVIAFAKHSETEEDLVVYQDLKYPEKIWARPRAMFEEEVEKNGKKIPRFSYLGAVQ